MKTLFEIYDASNSQADSRKDLTVQYLIDYADGAFDILLSKKKAQLIVDCIADYEKADAERKHSTSQDLWLYIEQPLREICA